MGARGPFRRLVWPGGGSGTYGMVTGGALLLVLLVVVRLAEAGPEPEPPALHFLEQVAASLDALETRCVETRGELSRLVLEMQQQRNERGEQGSALDILNQLRSALPASGEPQPCTEVAESMFDG
jgi:hypothetical protein